MFSANNVSRMRFGGINSGSDVESMVKAMGMAAQMRINKNKQKVLKLEAQQNSYRDVIKRLQDFQSKYFDVLKPANNLRSATVFNQTKAKIFNGVGDNVTPNGMSVTTAPGAVNATYDVELVRNASQGKVTGNRIAPDVSGGDLRSIDGFPTTPGSGQFGVWVQVGTESKHMMIDTDGFSTVEDALNAALKDAFGTTNAGTNKVTYNAGDGSIVSSDARAISVSNFTEMQSSHTFAYDLENASGKTSFNIQIEGTMRRIEFDSVSEADFTSIINNTVDSEGTPITVIFGGAEYLENPANAGKTLEDYERIRAAYISVLDASVEIDDVTNLPLFDPTNLGNATEVAKYFNKTQFENALANQTWGGGVKVEFDFSTGDLTATGGVGMAVTTNEAHEGNGVVLGAAYKELKATPLTLASNGTLAELGIADGEILTINGKDIELKSDMTLASLASAVNAAGAGVTMSYSLITQSFTLTSTKSGTDTTPVVSGTNGVEDLLGLGASATRVDGENLEIEISTNGGAKQLIETSGNSYTLDGTTFTFESTAKSGESMRVEVGRDMGLAVEVVKGFVEMYNNLVRDITIGMLQERPSSDYYHLTPFDIEEGGLTDREIEQWNTMANKGLLYQNKTVGAVMSDLRNVFNMSVANLGSTNPNARFGIGNIMGNDGTRALTQSTDWRNYGMLEFNEQAFTEALERNPEQIALLFTGENGLASRLNNELDRALNTRGPENTHGSLIRRAGLATGTTAKNNAIYERIKSLNSTIDILQRRYDKQQERFWTQFTNMERQFASLNAQSDSMSGIFMGLFGGQQ